ncbi:hypothetical protein ACP70R_008117 [Stipagrostis hirtigluma subsp. patula]
MPARGTDMDVWASPPLDLLLEIFGSLSSTDVVRCAGVCKPWRRAIIGNAASCLRPRPDRFLPDLLLGFFNSDGRWRQRPPGPFASALSVSAAAAHYAYEAACSFAAYTSGILSSRDGLLLLEGKEGDDLCLCNPMTGARTFIAAAAFKPDAYVLVSGYDLSPSDDPAVRIVAAEAEHIDTDVTIRYQLFSPTSGAAAGTGAWGPVMRSPVFKGLMMTRMYRCGEVISRGAVHWLAVSTADIMYTCTLAVDVRTGRTCRTELPEPCRIHCFDGPLLLATCRDGCLSVLRVVWDWSPGVQVWVLAGGDQWMLQQTIDVENFIWMKEAVGPRSGCILVEVKGQELLVDIESGSSRLLRDLDPKDDLNGGGWRFPYEMDWSTYLSKLKQF